MTGYFYLYSRFSVNVVPTEHAVKGISRVDLWEVSPHWVGQEKMQMELSPNGVPVELE